MGISVTQTNLLPSLKSEWPEFRYPQDVETLKARVEQMVFSAHGVPPDVARDIEQAFSHNPRLFSSIFGDSFQDLWKQLHYYTLHETGAPGNHGVRPKHDFRGPDSGNFRNQRIRKFVDSVKMLNDDYPGSFHEAPTVPSEQQSQIEAMRLVSAIVDKVFSIIDWSDSDCDDGLWFFPFGLNSTNSSVTQQFPLSTSTALNHLDWQYVNNFTNSTPGTFFDSDSDDDTVESGSPGWSIHLVGLFAAALGSILLI